MCLESMGTLSFVAPPHVANATDTSAHCTVSAVPAGAAAAAGRTADDVDGTDHACVRLRCGHAFHAPCILATFRSGIGCPTCRDPLQLQPPAPRRPTRTWLEISTDGAAAARTHAAGMEEDDGETIASDTSSGSGESIDLATITRMDARLAVLRSTAPQIRAARAGLNAALRRYRILSDDLRHARRQAIDAALRAFRRARMRDFVQAKRDVHARLRDVQDRELEALRGTESEADVRMFSAIATQFEYRTNHVLESRDYTSADPLRRHFWTRA